MKNSKAASNIATVAIFFAIMLVINFLTSLVFNLWPVPIKPTLIHVPVIIASIVYGPRIGATLGALMGVIFYQQVTSSLHLLKMVIFLH